MRTKTILFAAPIIVGSAVTLATGCSSSSSKAAAQPPTDASSEEAGDSSSSSASCSPLGTSSACPTGQGLTCCITGGVTSLLTGGTGQCEAPSDCTSTFQYECMKSSDCATGQVCCGELTADAGALAEAGLSLDGSSTDAEAVTSADGGFNIATILSAAADLTIEAFCQTSCTTGQQQLCGSNSDCSGGQVCATPAEGTSSLGTLTAALSSAGDSGTASLLSSYLGDASLPNLMTCQAPSDGGTDASTASEAGTVTEAGADTGATASDASGE